VFLFVCIQFSSLHRLLPVPDAAGVPHRRVHGNLLGGGPTGAVRHPAAPARGPGVRHRHPIVSPVCLLPVPALIELFIPLCSIVDALTNFINLRVCFFSLLFFSQQRCTGFVDSESRPKIELKLVSGRYFYPHSYLSSLPGFCNIITSYRIGIYT
jgi:hypothetical protein